MAGSGDADECDRRAVLRAAGAGALALGLAGCQSTDDGNRDARTAPATTVPDTETATRRRETTTADPTTHFLCYDVGDHPYAEYGASGTALLCDFERPAVFPVDRVAERDRGVRMRRDLEGHQADATVELLVRVDPHDAMGRPRGVAGAAEVGEVTFGEHTVTLHEDWETAERALARYALYLPYDDGSDIRFYRTTFRLSVTLPPERVPNKCAQTLDHTLARVARSVTPNEETTFGDLLSG